MHTQNKFTSVYYRVEGFCPFANYYFGGGQQQEHFSTEHQIGVQQQHKSTWLLVVMVPALH